MGGDGGDAPADPAGSGVGGDPGAELLHELGRDHGGHVDDVAGGVELDDVGPDDGTGKRGHQFEDLPGGEPARLVVGDAGGEGGIEAVEVDGDVGRSADGRRIEPAERAGLDRLDAEPVDLLALVGVGGADPDLDEAIAQPVLHDPGERRRVAEPIAVQLVVEVGVGVDVDDGEVGVGGPDGPQDGKGDRMIAAQNQRCGAAGQDRADALGDQIGVGVGPGLVGDGEVTDVGQQRADVDPRLGGEVGRAAVQLAPDGGRCESGAREVRRVGVDADAAQDDEARTDVVDRDGSDGHWVGMVSRTAERVPVGVAPACEDEVMAFGESKGYPASHRQVQQLTELIHAAGHTDFRDARGPLGLTQRQAGGKFTKDEADELIAQLEAEQDGGEPAAAPATPPTTDRRRSKYGAVLQKLPTDLLAAELQRRGWVVMEP